MRSDAREAAFQIVFADLFGGDGKKGFRTAIYKEHGLKEEDSAFAEALVTAVFAPPCRRKKRRSGRKIYLKWRHVSKLIHKTCKMVPFWSVQIAIFLLISRYDLVVAGSQEGALAFHIET